MRKRILPALIVFVITVIALVPSAMSQPQHGDERMYIWKAGYYGNLVAHVDIRRSTSDTYVDPGWSAGSFWAMEQPLGSHWIYAIVMGVTGTQPPTAPWQWDNIARQGPDTDIPEATLFAVRMAAIFCSALGAAFITFRFRWPAVVALTLFLLIPHVRDDLSRAWAEGPLLLGAGLCVIAYGSRWFAPACGLVASFKLTAMGLWPIAIWQGFGQGRFKHILALLLALMIWTATNPQSWLAGGPLYLLVMLLYRAWQYGMQTITYGVFLPSRYLWPVELIMLLTFSLWIQPRIQHSITPKQLPKIEKPPS